MGAAGAESLAAALGVASRLASLCLSANSGVGPRGAVSLCHPPTHPPTKPLGYLGYPLTHLLTHALIYLLTQPTHPTHPLTRPPTHQVALAAALPQSSLTALYLEGCALGASPMSRLAAALAASRLTVLDLASNEIMDEGAWELAWRLPECPHLERLLLAVSEIES